MISPPPPVLGTRLERCAMIIAEACEVEQPKIYQKWWVRKFLAPKWLEFKWLKYDTWYMIYDIWYMIIWIYMIIWLYDYMIIWYMMVIAIICYSIHLDTWSKSRNICFGHIDPSWWSATFATRSAVFHGSGFPIFSSKRGQRLDGGGRGRSRIQSGVPKWLPKIKILVNMNIFKYL